MIQRKLMGTSFWIWSSLQFAVVFSIIVHSKSDSRCFLVNGGSSVSFFVSEDAPIGYNLGTLEIQGDVTRDIILSLKESTAPVRIESGTKNVTLTRKLDKEGIEGPSTVTFTVLCDKRYNNEPSIHIPVTIRVSDVNDNHPKWIGGPFKLNISEQTLPGSTIISNLKAIDMDQHGPHSTLTFSALDSQGKPSSLVSFGGGGLEGRLILTRPLDYESMPGFNVTLRVKDQGTPPLHSDTNLEVTVWDADDQNPRFQHVSYSALLPTYPRGGTQLEIEPEPIRAFDQDTGINAPLVFSMPEGETNDYIVKTSSGLLRGFPMKTIRDRDIFAFTGIPYAEPPVGELRYRAPQRKAAWEGVLDATKMPPECLQIDGMQLLRIVGSESCLFANVYTPMLPKRRFHPNLPVMIFIHGGSFAFGSGAFGPSYLLDREVILVTFNYRLSSLGFLSTGDEAAPGNWGLKDQNLLLRWVHENIFSFGGNPSQITLFGQSAGGVSVNLHMMSKHSNGLFRAGISQSGNAMCFWGVRQDSIDFSYRFSNAPSTREYKVFPGVFFGPIVEPRSKDAFLSDRPEDLYNRNEVPPIPWINGFLADEGNGVGFLTYLYPFVIQEVDTRWSELGPKILDFKGDIRQVSKYNAAIRKFYLEDESINFETRKKLTQMLGDRLVVSAVHRGMQYHSRIAPVYGYFLNYTGRYGHAESYGLNTDEWGISHDDDLIYLMNNTAYHSLSVEDPEYEFSEFLTNVWVNFATFREPIYTTDESEMVQFWEPIRDPNNIQVARLDGDVPEMIPIPFKRRVAFWEMLGLVSKSYAGFPDEREKPNKIYPSSTPANYLYNMQDSTNYI